MTGARGETIAPILVAATAALVVAGMGAAMTDLSPWYRGLVLPRWQPPDWLFGPVWTVVFATTALSGYFAWRSAPDRATRTWVVGLFALNGCLNILWSALFFRLQRPDWALAEVVILWASILFLLLALRSVSMRASWLLAPYLAWVSFAAVLNWTVVRLNPAF